MTRTKRRRQVGHRLTISLGKGQRALLEDIAEKNHTSLAFILRYALERFTAENRDKQLPLELPSYRRLIENG
jgi:hypothetical protein